MAAAAAEARPTARGPIKEDSRRRPERARSTIIGPMTARIGLKEPAAQINHIGRVGMIVLEKNLAKKNTIEKAGTAAPKEPAGINHIKKVEMVILKILKNMMIISDWIGGGGGKAIIRIIVKNLIWVMIVLKELIDMAILKESAKINSANPRRGAILQN
jgi:hypothetical protein